MTLYNTGAIYHLIHIRQPSTIRNPRAPHLPISITLVLTTFLFLIMTTPASAVYMFFYDETKQNLLLILDGLLFTHHILSFPLYFLTLQDFRRTFHVMLKLKKPPPESTTIVNTLRDLRNK
jgi:ABC-type molybdate transport system permease subunit